MSQAPKLGGTASINTHITDIKSKKSDDKLNKDFEHASEKQTVKSKSAEDTIPKNAKLSLKAPPLKSTDNDKHSDKTKDRNGCTTDDEKISSTSNKNKEKPNSNTDDNKGGSNSTTDEKKVRESPRQKSDEKIDAASVSTADDKKLKESPRKPLSCDNVVAKDEKKLENISAEEKKKRESPRLRVEQGKDETISKLNEKFDKDSKKSTEKSEKDKKLNEKSSKEKIDNKTKKTEEKIVWEDEDMESLIVTDLETLAESSLPKSSPARVLKLRSGPPPTRARVSPFRTATVDNTPSKNSSSTVNIVIEQRKQSVPKDTIISRSPDTNYATGIRAVSGRKSVRLIRDSSYHHTYSESYRKFNDSASSMNATIGSEINYDSVRTPTISMFSRKRERVGEEIEQIVDEIESPKRMRIDISGFLGFVASPVLMLRDRIARLQSSTPNNTKTKEEKDEINPEDVTLDQDEIQDIEIKEVEDDNDCIIVESNNEDKPQNDDDIELKTITETKAEVIVQTSEATKRRMCSLM